MRDACANAIKMIPLVLILGSNSGMTHWGANSRAIREAYDHVFGTAGWDGEGGCAGDFSPFGKEGLIVSMGHEPMI